VVLVSASVARDRFRDTLERRKAQSTLQLLFKCARLLHELAIARVREQTGKPLRIAHTTLLPHVDLEGTRLTDLATRLQVTKQAAGQLVDELVEMKMLERVADPDDARAKLVRFTRRGRDALLHGLGTLASLEGDLATALGEKTMRDAHHWLAAIVVLLEKG
jgi:DNA-binding MarR family transcriptional regulator